MKKILTLCAIMLMFCLVGCENDDNAQQTSTKHEDGSDDNVQQTPTGYEQGNVQNMYVYYNNVLYIYTDHNNDIEENEISYIYKNYAKVGNVEKRSDKEMPDEEFEASNIDIGVSIYANEEDASKVLLYTTKVFELDRVE